MPKNVLKDYNEIIRVLQDCQSNGDVWIVVNEKEYHGKIEKISPYNFTVKLDEPLQTQNLEDSVCYIYTYERLYRFKTDGKPVDSSGVILLIPTELEELVKRKHPRLVLKGGENIAITEISVKRQIKQQVQITNFSLMNIYSELQREKPDVNYIINETKKLLGDFVDFFHLQLWKAEETNMWKQLFSKGIDGVYIFDTMNIMGFIKVDIPGILSFASALQELGADEQTILKRIKDFQEKLLANNIRELLVIPFKVFDNPIGHIECYIKTDSMKRLRQRDVFFVKALGEVLGEAVERVRLQDPKIVSAVVKIRDISLGGIKLVVPISLSKYFEPKSRFRVSLKIENSTINPMLEVVWNNIEEKQLILGAKFVEISQDSYVILSSWINRMLEEKGIKPWY